MKKYQTISGAGHYKIYRGYEAAQLHGIEIECIQQPDGNYLISGDPLHVKCALAMARVADQCEKDYARCEQENSEGEDADAAAFERVWEKEQRAMRLAIAPLFVALLKSQRRKKAPANKPATKRAGRKRRTAKAAKAA